MSCLACPLQNVDHNTDCRSDALPDQCQGSSQQRAFRRRGCAAAIFSALSPHYMFKYWRSEHSAGWEIMSGVLLCITGVEAMYADLGHFSRRAVQVRCSPSALLLNSKKAL